MRQPLLDLLQWLTPRGGWLVPVLLLVSLEAVVWSVEAADWGNTPDLAVLMLIAVGMGVVVARQSRRVLVWHMAALALGAAMVYWRGAALSEAPGWPEKFVELNQRLSQFWSAAGGGGIGTDVTPFLLGLGAFTWITGYLSAWVIFRYRNLWLGVLPGALAMTTHLSYLPDRFLPYLYLYLFFTMLLAVRLHTLEREDQWERRGILSGATPTGLATLYQATWFLAAVFLLGILLPVSSVTTSTFKETWNSIRWPAERAEVEFARLFSSLPARKPTGVQTFGDYLPFQGPISLGEQTVFTVKSPVAAYWRSRVYPIYTPQGWKADQTVAYPLTELPEGGQPREELASSDIQYTVTLEFQASSLPVNALPLEASEPAQVEVQPSRSFFLRLDRTENLDYLPQDIQAAWRILAGLSGAGLLQEDLVETLLAALPQDTLVTDLRFRESSGARSRVRVPQEPLDDYPETLRRVTAQRSGALVSLRVARVPPSPPDILRLRSVPRLDAGTQYSVTSRTPTTSPEELREVETDYPGWVTDTYLQLPDTFPQRLVDLAQELTAGESNLYDKAMAVQTHLKALPYDQQIPTPPFDADGVDYFLFTVQRGYSDYFGSAMATLLRAVDIPTRLVVGHTPGILDKDAGVYVVRDRDSHAWPEVYFPGYGWVEFEPTPGFSIPGTEGAQEELAVSDFFDEDLEDLFDEDDDLFLEDLEDSAEGDQSGVLAAIPGLGQPTPLGGTVLALALLLAVAGLWYLYRRLLVRVPGSQAAYERMSGLASLAGAGPVTPQTPGEFARSLARRFPEVGQEMRRLGELYSRARYRAVKETPAEELESMEQAWGRVRRRLLRSLVRRYPFFWLPSGRQPEAPEPEPSRGGVSWPAAPRLSERRGGAPRGGDSRGGAGQAGRLRPGGA